MTDNRVKRFAVCVWPECSWEAGCLIRWIDNVDYATEEEAKRALKAIAAEHPEVKLFVAKI